MEPEASPRRRGTSALVAVGLLGALFGAFVGSVVWTFHQAKATSYLSDDPRSCINCHVMNEHYQGWLGSTHHAWATCNDCHVPHDSLLRKYLVKAEHGYRHSKGFTFQDFHEPIQITASSRRVVNENCIRCHDALTHDIRLAGGHGQFSTDSGGLDCIHCHARVAHGPLR